ncbi:hypothetical protein Salat_0855500 [Sesamum alatum]|uniref:Uncharacterized protein n=1 Tax=Sesamum alatum TaxID=300844 RepID=A0AAE1YIK7_9LAMI|nr:hypothetical protein Salat_0855500 [Sesamum alatum]
MMANEAIGQVSHLQTLLIEGNEDIDPVFSGSFAEEFPIEEEIESQGEVGIVAVPPDAEAGVEDVVVVVVAVPSKKVVVAEEIPLAIENATRGVENVEFEVAAEVETKLEKVVETKAEIVDQVSKMTLSIF